MSGTYRRSEDFKEVVPSTHLEHISPGETKQQCDVRGEGVQKYPEVVDSCKESSQPRDQHISLPPYSHSTALPILVTETENNHGIIHEHRNNNEPGRKQEQRILGLRVLVFWLLLLVITAVVFSGIGVGIAFGLRSKHAHTPPKSQPMSTTTSSLESTQSTTATSTHTLPPTTIAFKPKETGIIFDGPVTELDWGLQGFEIWNFTGLRSPIIAKEGSYFFDTTVESYKWNSPTEQRCCLTVCQGSSKLHFYCEGSTANYFTPPLNNFKIACEVNVKADDPC